MKKNYKDKTLSPEERASLVLAEMTVEEKIFQISAQMIYDADKEYNAHRDYRCGHYRNPGHFLHMGKPYGATAAEVAKAINRDTEAGIEANRLSIPPLQNDEALHGAQWGMATCFPQPIAMASSFDKELAAEVADTIGKEVRAVGVRQVFAPVVNLATDCRWGRTMETYGEDVLLSSDMGVAMCRGMQKNGVLATPKHFADNFAAGGRDSNNSERSERTLREQYLKPFEKCFREGGAHSVMAAYNAVDGVPCSCNRKLLTDILRKEWGFQGFVVSDYGGVERLARSESETKGHGMAEDYAHCQAMALQAGLDVTLPFPSLEYTREALRLGLIDEKILDAAALRVLTEKFRCGLCDEPFADPEEAQKLVRCEKHKELARKAAEESIVLLKNNHVLPIDVSQVRRIGVFGPGADEVPIGKNYSGPYGGWRAADVMSPAQALKKYCGEKVEIVRCEDGKISEAAGSCDINLYFTAIVEGEGLDRCDLKLPNITEKKQENGNALIVGKYEISIRCNQEQEILEMCGTNRNSVVVLLNGAPIDVTDWEKDSGAILEAWYPGEQGAAAIADILFGSVCPGAKLPITFPKCIGQLPLPYSYKTSGRGYGYAENDGLPRYEFGFGLSYTTFESTSVRIDICGNDRLHICFHIRNTGRMAGAEVVQVYLQGWCCGVVRPLKELKAYRRILLEAGQGKDVQIALDRESFCYYDENMDYGMHDSRYIIMVGTSSTEIHSKFKASVRDGKIRTES